MIEQIEAKFIEGTTELILTEEGNPIKKYKVTTLPLWETLYYNGVEYDVYLGEEGFGLKSYIFPLKQVNGEFETDYDNSFNLKLEII